PICSSEEVRERVVSARERQTARLREVGVTCNAHLDATLVRRHVALDQRGTAILRRAYDRGTLSPRGHDRVLRVARTIADLDDVATVGADQLLEALGLRQDITEARGEEAA